MIIRKIKNKIVLSIVLLNLMIFSCGTVYAVGDKVSLELPVKQIMHVPKQMKMIGTYELISLTEEAPMPENNNNGVYSFFIEGTENTEMIPITYLCGGIYKYKLIQTTKELGNYIYDRTEYEITVYIKNVEDGVLASEIIVENSSGRKCEKIIFTNQYKEEIVSKRQETNQVKTNDETKGFLWLIIGCSYSLLILLIILIRDRANKKYT